MTGMLAARLVTCVVLLGGAPALAQVLLGEFSYATRVVLTEGAPAGAFSALTARLEATHAIAPFEVRLVAEPSLRIAADARFEAGVTDAFVRYRHDDLVVSVGLERLPLETARSSTPFAVGPVSPGGVRQGVPGLRVSWFGSGNRVRLAVFHDGGGLAGAISARHEFGFAEVEGHAVAGTEGFALGLGGSGLVGALVVYGEAWLLTDPIAARGALGVSGFVDEALWTAEVAYLPRAPGLGPRPALLGAVDLQGAGQDDLRLAAVACLDADALRGELTLAYRRREPEGDVTAVAAARVGPGPVQVAIGIDVRTYFALQSAR